MLTSSLLLFDIFTNLVTQALSVKATMMNITRGCLYNCLLSLLFAQHGRSEDISIINLKMALHSQSLLWPSSLQTAASSAPVSLHCRSLLNHGWLLRVYCRRKPASLLRHGRIHERFSHETCC